MLWIVAMSPPVSAHKSNRGASPADPYLESMKKLLVALGAVLAGLVACERKASEPVSASSTAPSSNPYLSTTASASSTAKSACPRTGQWALCSVEKRLEQSGFVVIPVKGQPPHRAGFSVLPAVYNLGRSRLEVFLYPSAAAAARDVAGLDTTIAAPPGRSNQWEMPPTFVRSANLIAVFLTESPVQGERLTLALTAGAPQP
jgi:hypothetical protein